MSQGFKAFLLLVALFSAFWVYRYQEKEFHALQEIFNGLRGNWPPARLSAADGSQGALLARSPVEKVLDPTETYLTASWRRMEESPASPEAADPDAEVYAAPGAGGLGSPEETAPIPPEEASRPEAPSAEPREHRSGDRAADPGPQKDAGPLKHPRTPDDPRSLKDPGAAALADPASAHPPKALPAKFREVEHLVGAQETLWSIAEKYLGKGQRFTEILEWNRLDGDPSRVRPGTRLVLHLPEPSRAAAGPGTEEKTAQAAKKTDKPAEPAPDGKTRPILHAVKDGETLRRLARLYYKDKERWQQIYQANKELIDNPDSLRVGITLRIPMI